MVVVMNRTCMMCAWPRLITCTCTVCIPHTLHNILLRIQTEVVTNIKAAQLEQGPHCRDAPSHTTLPIMVFSEHETGFVIDDSLLKASMLCCLYTLEWGSSSSGDPAWYQRSLNKDRNALMHVHSKSSL